MKHCYLKIKTALFWIGIILFIFGCDSKSFDDIWKETSIKTAKDALDKAKIAMDNRDWMSACFQFGIAKVALLDAKDEENYKKAIEFEKKACKMAGLP